MTNMTSHSKWDDSDFEQRFRLYQTCLSWIKSLEILYISMKFPLSYDVFKKSVF